MKFLFADSFNTVKTIDLPFRPVVGDRIDWDYNPPPTIKNVLLRPKFETIKELADTLETSILQAGEIEAIVYLD